MAKCQPIGLGPEKTDGGEFTAVFKMTESQLLIATKYPDHKGFTREEYEAATDDYMARKSRSHAKLFIVNSAVPVALTLLPGRM